MQRLPPAHVLAWTPSSGVTVRAFWRLQAVAPRRHDADVTAHFRETLQQAVDDRLAGQPATVLMSGGIDSTLVAAMAVRSRSGTAVRALTSVHRALPNDMEEQFASMAAHAIGVSWDTHLLDGYGLFDRWDGDARPVLPMAEPFTAVMADVFERVSAHGGVVLSGDGGDPLLLPATLPRHAGRMPAWEIARGVWRLGVRAIASRRSSDCVRPGGACVRRTCRRRRGWRRRCAPSTT